MLGLKEETNASKVTPASIWREEISLFLRDARYITPISVYQCELWEEDLSKSLINPVRPTIPFMMNVQIGFTAAAEAFRVAKGLPATMSNKEVKANKAFTYNPMGLMVAFHEMNLQEQPSHKFSRLKSNAFIKSISIVNLPTKSTSAAPCSKWLEMNVKEVVVPAGTKRENIDVRKVKDSAANYHVSYVEIETSDDMPFDLMVDGQYLGQFYKVRLQPCTTPSKRPITFPVASFLPLALQ